MSTFFKKCGHPQSPENVNMQPLNGSTYPSCRICRKAEMQRYLKEKATPIGDISAWWKARGF